MNRGPATTLVVLSMVCVLVAGTVAVGRGEWIAGSIFCLLAVTVGAWAMLAARRRGR
jgi:hypothetical protein